MIYNIIHYFVYWTEYELDNMKNDRYFNYRGWVGGLAYTYRAD